MSGQTLGASIAYSLNARGVDTIFGIPGVHNVELYRGIQAAGITTPLRFPAPDPSDIHSLAALLNAASKPLFIFGGGAVGASAPARDVVGKSGAAVFTTNAGRGVVSPVYALNYGATLARPDSARVLGLADLVIAVGTELGEVDLWRDKLGHTAHLVRIDIDQTVLDDAHGADLKIVGECGAVLAALADQLKPSAAKWDAAGTAATRAAFRAESDAERPGIVPFVAALHDALPKNTLIYSDMTQFAYVAKELYPMEHPGLWHHPYGFGTLGYALPAAIGGKIGVPHRPVVAIVGDSGFQYTMQELGVAAELSLCLPIILWDNSGLKEIEAAMIQSQIAPNAVIAKNPDFSQLAAAYGVGYSAPGLIAAFQDAVQAALSADGPTIVHTTPQPTIED